MCRRGYVGRHGGTARRARLRRPGRGKARTRRHSTRIAARRRRETRPARRHATAHASRTPHTSTIGRRGPLRPRCHARRHGRAGRRRRAEKHATAAHDAAANVHGDLDAHFALLGVQQEVEAGGAHAGQLAHDDVLRNASHGVHFSVGGRLHQHVHRLLKTTPHKGASVLPALKIGTLYDSVLVHFYTY